MKYALVLFLAATIASIGCGGGTTISSPSSTQPPVVQTPPTAPPPPPAPVAPATHYQILDLAPIPGAGYSQANAVSSGHPAGYSALTGGIIRATFWQGIEANDLGNGDATSINQGNAIAGYVSQPDNTQHATLWANGTVSDLLTIVGYDSSIATGINDSNEIVGISFVLANPSNQVAFRWTQATGMQAIPGSATAGGVNSAGDVAGMDQNLRAAIFTASGTVINLGTLGDFSIAIAINKDRHVSGYSPLVVSGPVHPFFYDGSSLRDLGTLRSGAASYSTALNDQDLVIGNDTVSGDSRPWIWSATTGIEDLNGLIPQDSGWKLLTANGIDQNGNIVGSGVVSGAVHGFLLTPEN